MNPEPPEDFRPPASALQLELPSALPSRVAPAALPADHEGMHQRAARGARPIAIVVVALAVLGIVALEVLVPRFVRRQCMAEADAHGITLSIEGVAITSSGFVLNGVKATAADLPGATLEAPQLAIATHNLRPEKLTGTAVAFEVSGRWSAFSSALARWRASDRGGQGGAWAPESVIIDGSRIHWRGPIGEQADVTALDVHLEIAWSSSEPAIHATSRDVKVDVPGGTLGPWRFDIDRDAGSSRARIALDPAVPDGCTILVVGNDQTITSADITIPRSPIAHLGIGPALGGLRGNLQLEAEGHYAAFGKQGTATAIVKGGVYGATVQGLSLPLDLAWDIKGAGHSAVVDLRDARIAVGPLVGTARGTLKTYDDGFRIDLAWSAGPVPCAAFDLPLAPARPFDVAYQLRKLTQDGGPPRRRGDVSANAALVFDSRDLGATTFTFTPKAACGTAIGL